MGGTPWLSRAINRDKDRESLWRDEFSVFQERERFVDRRQLIKFLTLTSLGMFAGNVWILLKILVSSRRYQLPAAGDRARIGNIPVGGVKLFRYPNPKEQCLLVRSVKTITLRTHRNARICPAPFITPGKTINSSVRAITAGSPFATAPLFKGRRPAHCLT